MRAPRLGAHVTAVEIDSDEDGFELLLEIDDGERYRFNIQAVALDLLRQVDETIRPWADEGGLR